MIFVITMIIILTIILLILDTNEIIIGSEVIINNNNTYFGYTGEEGIVIDIYQDKLYMVDVCGKCLAFTKNVLDLK